MARTMRRREADFGACTREHLFADGFTMAEIIAYADDARAILSGRRPAPVSPVARKARREGKRLVAKAKAVRARQTGAEARA